jgi:starvation-inducible DNA-binding protein
LVINKTNDTFAAMKNNYNPIGLDMSESEKLSKELHILLSDYSLLYQNVRGFHWNVKGDAFFELHIKFEELYNDLFLKIDEIAERILTLGFTPEHRFSQYAQSSTIAEVENTTDGKEGLRFIVSSFQSIIIKQRDILALSNDMGDEGTNALMSDYIRTQEKLVWMYTSYLG